MTLTRDEVISVLGSVDDSVVAEVIATGADQAELAKAYAWVTSDEALVNDGRSLPSGRVGELVDILRALDDVEDEEPEVPPIG